MEEENNRNIEKENIRNIEEQVIENINKDIEKQVEKEENNYKEEETKAEGSKGIQKQVQEEGLIKCKKCGAVLDENQKFCSHCGEPNNVTVELKTKKHNVKKKLIITFGVIIVLAIVVAVAGKVTYNSYEKKADNCIEYLINGQYSDALSKYEELGNIGKKIFREDISEEFIETVKNNKYKAGASGTLVNEEAIGKYEQLKKIADTLELKKDNSKVVEYIDAVLKLKDYEKYNEILKCVLAGKDELAESFKYVQNAASSVYLVDYYIGKAQDSANNAYNKAINYDLMLYHNS